MMTRRIIGRTALAWLCAAAATGAVAQASNTGAVTPGDAVVSSAGSTASIRAAKKAKRKSNRQLVKRVSQALGRTRGLDSTRISVGAKDGVVTLSGTTADNVQAGLAVSAAQQVPGVLQVKNQLRIGTQNW